MKESDIRKYAQLMKELDLTGLEITEDNQVVRLERSAAGKPAAAEPAAPAVPAAPARGERGDSVIVRSPMVGLFYAAPAENAEPYVSPGDRVKPGQTLCIVEAMKLMNEITAEDGGVIETVCVTNGQMVEYGTELFHIRREPA